MHNSIFSVISGPTKVFDPGKDTFRYIKSNLSTKCEVGHPGLTSQESIRLVYWHSSVKSNKKKKPTEGPNRYSTCERRAKLEIAHVRLG